MSPSNGQSRERRDMFLVMAVFIALGLASRYLDRDLWYDEAYTLTGFTNRGVWGALTDYEVPNNHIVFTAALIGHFKLCTWLDLPGWTMRLLPLACSVTAVGFLYVAVRGWRGQAAALWSALLLGTSHFFLSFSCQLRGYALSALLSSLSLLLALKLVRKVTKADLAAYGLVSVLAVGTIPTNLVFYGSLGLWLIVGLARRGTLRQRSGQAACAAVTLLPLAGLGWYLWHPTVRQQFVHHFARGRSSVASPLRQVASLLAELGYEPLVDYFWLFPVFAVGIGVLFLRDESRETQPRREEFLFLLAGLLPLAIGGFVALFPRNFLIMLPWWAAAAGIHCSAGCEELAARWPRAKAVLSCLLPLAALLACYREISFDSRYLRRYEDDRPQGAYYQYHNVAFHPGQVAEYLKGVSARQPTAIFYDDSDPIAFSFFARMYGLERLQHSVQAAAPMRFRMSVTANMTVYLVSHNRTYALMVLAGLNSPPAADLDVNCVLDTGFFKVYAVLAGPDAPTDQTGE